MATRRRPTGNCPHCHRDDVRFVVTLPDGSIELACGACADGYERADGLAVEALA